MKTKKLLLLPLLGMLLTACQPTPQASSTTTLDSTSNSSSETSQTTSSTTTTSTSEISSESTTEIPSSSTTSEEEKLPEESSESSSSSEEENKNYIPSSGQQLPCGSTTVDGPENVANPLDLDEWKNFDTTSYMPDNFSYIYGNNKTNPKFYANEDGGIKIDDPRKGFQTPLLKSYKKIEFNLHISHLGPKDKKTKPDETKEQFHIYGYDINGKWIYTQKIDKLKVDKNNNNNRDIKLDILDTNVRYLEFRMNAFPYDSSNQCYNIGIGKVSLKGWNY